MTLFRGTDIFRRILVVGAVLAALISILYAYKDGWFEDDFDRMVAPAVTVIVISAPVGRPFGSGTVISSTLKDGKYETYILTAYHVIATGKREDGTWLPIRIHSFAYHHRKRIQNYVQDATVVKTSPDDDLALLMFTDTVPFRHVARLGNNPTALDRVYAVGFPLGLNLLMTEGIVGGTQGSFNEPLIYSTAPIMLGNSGGALYGSSRKLVGVSNAVMVLPRGPIVVPVPHMHLAVPVSTVKKFLEDSPVKRKTQ